MTTSPAPTPAVFAEYAGNRMPVPADMPLTQLKDQMARFFPELADPAVTEKKEGESTIYVFSKQAGRKGQIYPPNTTRWHFGAHVIHDADRKEERMLMRVLGRADENSYFTTYLNKTVSTDVYINRRELLHDPRGFGIVRHPTEDAPLLVVNELPFRRRQLELDGVKAEIFAADFDEIEPSIEIGHLSMSPLAARRAAFLLLAASEFAQTAQAEAVADEQDAG